MTLQGRPSEQGGKEGAVDQQLKGKRAAPIDVIEKALAQSPVENRARFERQMVNRLTTADLLRLEAIVKTHRESLTRPEAQMLHERLKSLHEIATKLARLNARARILRMQQMIAPRLGTPTERTTTGVAGFLNRYRNTPYIGAVAGWLADSIGSWSGSGGTARPGRFWTGVQKFFFGALSGPMFTNSPFLKWAVGGWAHDRLTRIQFEERVSKALASARRTAGPGARVELAADVITQLYDQYFTKYQGENVDKDDTVIRTMVTRGGASAVAQAILANVRPGRSVTFTAAMLLNYNPKTAEADRKKREIAERNEKTLKSFRTEAGTAIASVQTGQSETSARRTSNGWTVKLRSVSAEGEPDAEGAFLRGALSQLPGVREVTVVPQGQPLQLDQTPAGARVQLPVSQQGLEHVNALASELIRRTRVSRMAAESSDLLRGGQRIRYEMRGSVGTLVWHPQGVDLATVRRLSEDAAADAEPGQEWILSGGNWRPAEQTA